MTGDAFRNRFSRRIVGRHGQEKGNARFSKEFQGLCSTKVRFNLGLTGKEQMQGSKALRGWYPAQRATLPEGRYRQFRGSGLWVQKRESNRTREGFVTNDVGQVTFGTQFGDELLHIPRHSARGEVE